jgi:hypothetical protein
MAHLIDGHDIGAHGDCTPWCRGCRIVQLEEKVHRLEQRLKPKSTQSPYDASTPRRTPKL